MVSIRVPGPLFLRRTVHEAPPTSQNPAEFAQLLELFRARNPLGILEIGVHEGGTLYHWLKNARQGAIVTAVDDQHINEARYTEWAQPGVLTAVFRGKSQDCEAIDFIANLSPYNWIFIDGGHSYDEVKRDWQTAQEWAAEDAIVAFHDIAVTEPYVGSDGVSYPHEVHRLWEEISLTHFHDEIVEPHPEWGRGPGIGVVYL